MTKTINFRNDIQATLYSAILVPELTKGHWGGSYPRNHGESWKDAEAAVNEKALGVDFEPVRAHYDLLSKEFVDAVADKAIKVVKKQTGEAITPRDLRSQLKDMMFIMRTPKGKALATSNQGLMDRPGRPSKEALERILAKAGVPAKAAAVGAKAAAKVALKDTARKAPAKQAATATRKGKGAAQAAA